MRLFIFFVAFMSIVKAQQYDQLLGETYDNFTTTFNHHIPQLAEKIADIYTVPELKLHVLGVHDFIFRYTAVRTELITKLVKFVNGTGITIKSIHQEAFKIIPKIFNEFYKDKGLSVKENFINALENITVTSPSLLTKDIETSIYYNSPNDFFLPLFRSWVDFKNNGLLRSVNLYEGIEKWILRLSFGREKFVGKLIMFLLMIQSNDLYSIDRKFKQEISIMLASITLVRFYWDLMNFSNTHIYSTLKNSTKISYFVKNYVDIL